MPKKNIDPKGELAPIWTDTQDPPEGEGGDDAQGEDSNNEE